MLFIEKNENYNKIKSFMRASMLGYFEILQ